MAESTQEKPWAAPFFILWIGQALSLVGSQVGGFALVWRLTEASGRSATVLATAALVAVPPACILDPIVNGPFFAVLKDLVDPEVQGRIFAAIGSVTAAASPVGMAVAGPVAGWLGVQVWFLLGGLICVLMGVGMFFIPAVIDLKAHGQVAAQKVDGVSLADN